MHTAPGGGDGAALWNNPAPDAPGSNTGTQSGAGGSSMDRTKPHNAAVTAAVAQLTVQYGLDPGGFIDYRRVSGAAKRCMGTAQSSTGCGYGVPDIMYLDPLTGQLMVWEVKSASQAGLAAGEAQWYVNWLNKQKAVHAVLGSTFDPISYGGNVVVGPSPGTAIYTQGNPQSKPAAQPTGAPVPRGVPAVVPATPGPGFPRPCLHQAVSTSSLVLAIRSRRQRRP